MSNKRRDTFDLTTNDPNVVIEVCVRYSKHDGSYYDPNAEQQGYWLNVTPVKLEGAKRFGAKKFETLMTGVKHEVLTGHTEDRWVKLALRVAEENGLTITQWSKKD